MSQGSLLYEAPFGRCYLHGLQTLELTLSCLLNTCFWKIIFSRLHRQVLRQLTTLSWQLGVQSVKYAMFWNVVIGFLRAQADLFY